MAAKKPEGTKGININMQEELLDRLDKYRFKRMFPTRTEAIEFLLDYALKANPKRPESETPQE